jgi:excisionase family DNA binding protein
VKLGQDAIRTRLLSPDGAAAYLGLGSRWAIYRLVAAGSLPALKIAGKLRIDRADLDAFIDSLKSAVPMETASSARGSLAAVPGSLAPLDQPRARRRRVTTPVTAAGHDA